MTKKAKKLPSLDNSLLLGTKKKIISQNDNFCWHLHFKLTPKTLMSLPWIKSGIEITVSYPLKLTKKKKKNRPEDFEI